MPRSSIRRTTHTPLTPVPPVTSAFRSAMGIPGWVRVRRSRSALRIGNRYRLRWREAVRDPSTSLALLASLRVTVKGCRVSQCKHHSIASRRFLAPLGMTIMQADAIKGRQRSLIGCDSHFDRVGIAELAAGRLDGVLGAAQGIAIS